IFQTEAGAAVVPHQARDDTAALLVLAEHARGCAALRHVTAQRLGEVVELAHRARGAGPAARFGPVEDLGERRGGGARAHGAGRAVDPERALPTGVVHLAELVADREGAPRDVAVDRARRDEADAGAHREAVDREPRELLDAPLAAGAGRAR